VENFRPGVMASMGLDYDKLAEINPELIMTSISCFGQVGTISGVGWLGYCSPGNGRIDGAYRGG